MTPSGQRFDRSAIGCVKRQAIDHINQKAIDHTEIQQTETTDVYDSPAANNGMISTSVRVVEWSA